MAESGNKGTQWLTMELGGFEGSRSALIRHASEVSKATSPVLREFAQNVSKGAAARIDADKHPSGLFMQNGKPLGGSPRYKVRRKSPYYYKVETPARPWGYATALAEYAVQHETRQGEVLVDVLNETFGKANRVMYSVYDQLEPDYMARFTAATQSVEAKTNKETA